jgi:hypothetical protein
LAEELAVVVGMLPTTEGEDEKDTERTTMVETIKEH